jgi:hypothetical protein
MSEDRQGEPIRSFEDLEVFKRAYRISLEVHRISLLLMIEGNEIEDGVYDCPLSSVFCPLMVGERSVGR